MTLSGKRILILLGGQWHDFDGFAGAIKPLLEAHGMQVEATYDLDKLLHLADNQYDAVLSYTCFTSDEGGGTGRTGPTHSSSIRRPGWLDQRRRRAPGGSRGNRDR